VSNLYGDLNRLKALLSLTVTTGDAILLDLLERASRSIDDYCGQKGRGFWVTTVTRDLDGSRARQDVDGLVSLARLDVDPLLKITALYTDSSGTGTYTESWTEGAAYDYLAYPLNLYPKLWLACTLNSPYGAFAQGIPAGVRISGDFGWGDGLRQSPVDKTTATVKTTGSWTSGATTLDVTGESVLSAGMTILVDNEQLYISAVDTTAHTITVQRPMNGTTAATHAGSTPIYLYAYPAAITQAAYMQASRWWIRRLTAFATTIGGITGPIMEVHQGLDPDVVVLLQPYRPLKVG
jgi:hypothetical protein